MPAIASVFLFPPERTSFKLPFFEGGGFWATTYQTQTIPNSALMLPAFEDLSFFLTDQIAIFAEETQQPLKMLIGLKIFGPAQPLTTKLLKSEQGAG